MIRRRVGNANRYAGSEQRLSSSSGIAPIEKNEIRIHPPLSGVDYLTVCLANVGSPDGLRMSLKLLLDMMGRVNKVLGPSERSQLDGES